MLDLTCKQSRFIEHFPCGTCGDEPYTILRALQLDAYSDEVDMCPEGLNLLQQMLDEQGIEMHFEPQN